MTAAVVTVDTSMIGDYLDEILRGPQRAGIVDGYMIAARGVGPYLDPKTGKYKHNKHYEKEFAWPAKRSEMLAWLAKYGAINDVWVCPYLMTNKDRTVGNARWRQIVHADVDKAVDQAVIDLLGGFVVWSSGAGVDRAHVYIPLEYGITRAQHEALCEGLKKHLGGDSKVRDNDLLRPPGTYNHKPVLEAAPAGVPVVVAAQTAAYNRPGMNPVALGILIGVDITTIGSPTTAGSSGGGSSRNGSQSSAPAPGQDLEPVDLSAHDYLRDELGHRADPPDRSDDTFRIVCVAADCGLSLAQTRWVIDQRSDLRDRLAGRHDDDVWNCWVRCWDQFGRRQRRPAAAPLITPASSTNGQAPPAGGNAAAPPAGGTGGSVPPPAGGGAGGVGGGPGVPLALYPPPGVPMAVARRLVTDEYTERNLNTLVFWRDEFYRWERSYWVKVTASEMRAALYTILENVSYLDGSRMVRPWAPNPNKINGVAEAVRAVTILPSSVEQPVWIDTGRPANVLACANGLLDLSARDLRDLTPNLFNFVAVPFDCNPAAGLPARWLKFLAELWTDDDGNIDQESIDLLQEWFGYMVSGRTNMHKILLLIGPKRCGKGTIARILYALMGPRNCTMPTIGSMSRNFGMESFIGKSVAIIGDARTGSSDANYSTLVELLLSISGEDAKNVQRKNKTDWEGELGVRFTILSNELPKLHDASGAAVTRMMPLKIEQTWLDREDETLTETLKTELPAILLWALEGLARLERNRKFTKPASFTDTEEVMMDLVAPITQFVSNCCEMNRTTITPTSDIYTAYLGWCVRHGRPPSSRAVFVRDLLAAFPKLKRHRPKDPNDPSKRVQTYIGIRVLPITERL